MFKFLTDKSVLTTTLHLEKGAMIKAETLAAAVESLAKTMDGVDEGLKMPKHEIVVKNIKIKKGKVQISLKPVYTGSYFTSLVKEATRKKYQVTINQESYLVFLAKDVTSLGLLGFLCWFNYNFVGSSYFLIFSILFMIFLYCAKIKKSGVEDGSWYHGVSKEKIEQIKKIIKE